MKRVPFLTAVFALAITASLRAGLTDVSVRIEPPLQVVPLGSSFSINIVADISPAIVGWGLDLSVDTPGIASQLGLPSINSPWIAANAPDGDSLVGLALPFSPVNGSVSGTSILLATLTFHADAIGQTYLTPSATSGDLTEGFPLDPFGFASAGYTPGLVIVTPEPVFGLMGLGCIILAVRRRGRRTT